MDKIKTLLKNGYVRLVGYILLLVVLGILYHYFPFISTLGLVILGVAIVAFILSGNFKLAWLYLKYFLLGGLIAVILDLAHIAIFPWSIPLYIVGCFILTALDADKEPNEYLLKYIPEMRSLGLSDEQIIVKLQQAKWKTKDIHKAFEYISKIYDKKRI